MGPGRIGIEIHDTGPPRPLGRVPFAMPDRGCSSGDGVIRLRLNFTPATIVEARRHGFVPSPDSHEQGAWSSPDPRAIIVPRNLHIPRRLSRTIRQGRFYVSLDAAFDLVLAACADRPGRAPMNSSYRRAYSRLHRLGWAHSFEVWTVGGELVGGIYGLNIGGLFATDSMFNTVSDASKIAIVAMAQHCERVGVTLIDVHVMQPHLAAMGAVAIPANDYLEWVGAVAPRQVAFAGRRSEPEPSPYEGWALMNTSL